MDPERPEPSDPAEPADPTGASEPSGPSGANRGEPEPEYRNAAFTFEGQIERLQQWVVGVNRRGGSEKRLVRSLVIAGICLLLLAYFSGIFWGIFIR